jgi:hypothetical protein
MGGYDLKRRRSIMVAEPQRKGNDPCDLSFRVDLVGVRSSVLERITQGHVLEVALIDCGQAVSAVCRIDGGEIVGALAAFRGLAQLIRCLNEGVQFNAYVTMVTPARCEVRVERLP